MPAITRTNAQVAAQVAVEACINNFEDYEPSTALAVWRNGLDNGTAALYMDMLQALIEA